MHRHTQCPDPDPMIGQTIHEFQIEKKLAEGGMGAVYLARHRLMTNTAKVIKVLLPKFAQMPLLRQRFHREAKAASKLQHENILGIDNFGTLEDGQLFIMVPYLEGQPLDAYLHARGGRLAPHRALHLIVQLCDALMCAHGAGIIHRDLKPGNVFVVPTSSNPYKLKLLDFGIAKVGGSDGSPGTQSGSALGTPGYMAVEHYEYADEATHLADIYSLAVMTWEMVTGRLPWQHQDISALYRLQRTSQPERPPVDIMPERWADTLLAAMSIEPLFRPQSARALALALASGLPAIGQVPSGAEIVASLAPHFIRQGDPCDETVRNCAEVERMVPLLWPPRETAPSDGAPKPPAAPIATPPVAAAPALATTISSGAVGLSPAASDGPGTGGSHWRGYARSRSPA
jgi:serine/threonine-protein kinase